MQKSNSKKQKVFVGMSGGVDSSVSALLLKNLGYEVTGVFIKVWQPDFIECTWREDRQDAMRVCAQLNIPFITLDLEKEYKKGVIDYMVREYKVGRTPNPDVFCNKEVKFGAFLNWAIKNGADYVATGHYARIKNKQLLRSKDLSKDQSYFLWTLNSKQLSKILFPVGNLLKTEIREIAKENNLYTASKKDSQGLCFIGKIEIKDFLGKYLKNKSGIIINENTKKENGKHKGIELYTIGEKINGKYIVRKDIKKNILYVVDNLEEDNLINNEIKLTEINFTENLKVKGIYTLQERYHSQEVKIKIIELKINKSRSELSLKYKLLSSNNLLSVSGQSLVFYNKQTLIGGGIIK